MESRRDFLKKTALLTGAAGLSTILPASIQRALAINPAPGSTYLDAEHVVILMQENRSFDHCFGTLQGVRGFNDPRAITLPNGNPVWLQQNTVGETYVPFRFNIKDTKSTWMNDLPHVRSSQVDAFNHGKFNKWLDSKRSSNPKYADMPLTLGYYNREDLPFNYALADAFTICDQNFSSAMTSTWPNRHFMWTGTIRESENPKSKAHVRNDLNYGLGKWRTFPEELEDHDVSWKIYQNNLSCGGGYSGEERAWLSNFGCNTMELFEQYNVKFNPKYVNSLQAQAKTLPQEIQSLTEQKSKLSHTDPGSAKLQKDIEKKQEVLAYVHQELKTWSEENFNKLPQKSKNLFTKAFDRNTSDPDFGQLSTFKYKDGDTEREVQLPKGDIFYNFRNDADNGKLPTVSWLTPPQNFSDHPSAPWYGAWYVSEVLDILTKNPEVWKKTIFILTYDENDGFFDHVPPFIPPDLSKPHTGKCSAGIKTEVEYISKEDEISQGINKKEARDGVIGLGYRVPMIIASPWSRGGQVCSQVFDHTSSLQFLEKFLAAKKGKPVRQDSISQWRRTVCGDLTSVFRRYEEGGERISFLEREPFVADIYNAKFKKEPNGFKKLTTQQISEAKKNAKASFLPQQEKGVRPACALPYEMYADGHLSADKKKFEITMSVGKSLFKEETAGAPFKVYAPGSFSDEQGHAADVCKGRDYAVAAGDTQADFWRLDGFHDSRYHLKLYGPNGFFREFSGSSNSPQLEISLRQNASGQAELSIINRNPLASYQVSIVHNEYQYQTISKDLNKESALNMLLNLEKSFGWYDFSVRVNGFDSFDARYAGHIENGKPSFTDPAMGRV
ncbi:MAG: phospholipase phosphocholine-specific [Sphingobacteriaceae bacterium]|jgi:phospholipase C|nr:phospholipase phosphocholine-specific [Sphingobacteriaceae bacterium]